MSVAGSCVLVIVSNTNPSLSLARCDIRQWQSAPTRYYLLSALRGTRRFERCSGGDAICWRVVECQTTGRCRSILDDRAVILAHADYRRDLELSVTQGFGGSAEKAQCCHRLKREWEIKSLSSPATSCRHRAGARRLLDRAGRGHQVNSLGGTRINLAVNEERRLPCSGD